jgi:hypothetical protein
VGDHAAQPLTRNSAALVRLRGDPAEGHALVAAQGFKTMRIALFLIAGKLDFSTFNRMPRKPH